MVNMYWNEYSLYSFSDAALVTTNVTNIVDKESVIAVDVSGPQQLLPTLIFKGSMDESILSIFELENNTDIHYYFNMKNTIPNSVKITPTCGTIRPHQKIQLITVLDPNSKSRFKIMVESLIAENGGKYLEFEEAREKIKKSDSSKVIQSRLVCVRQES